MGVAEDEVVRSAVPFNTEVYAHDGLWWNLLLVFGVVCLLLGIYGFMRKGYERLPGPAFLTLYGIVVTLAAVKGGATQHVTVRFVRLPLGAELICYGGLSLTLVLYVRLHTSANYFGGDAFNLNFGKLWCERKGLRDNIGLQMEFNSIGHAAQGVLAVFLFPGTEWLLRQVHPGLALGGRAASMLLVVYPVYNLVKRLKKHGNYFAVCSFFNNCIEWAMGFYLGLFLGLLCHEDINFAPGVLNAKLENLGWSGVESYWTGLEIARVVIGIIFLVAVACAAVAMAWTWDNMPDEMREAIQSSARESRRSGNTEESRDDEKQSITTGFNSSNERESDSSRFC